MTRLCSSHPSQKSWPKIRGRDSLAGAGTSLGRAACGQGLLPAKWGCKHLCDRVDQLPSFPYNRGWETQPSSRGLYTHYKDSY